MLWPFGRSMGSVVFMSQWAVFGGERKMEERDLSNCKSMRVFLFFFFFYNENDNQFVLFVSSFVGGVALNLFIYYFFFY